MNKDIILKNIYPEVSSSMDKNNNKFKKCVSNFLQIRSKQLYDICPCDRIYFGKDDIDEFYKSINISEKDIKKDLQNTYYYPISNFNPAAAKDEFTITMMNIIRYYKKKKMNKEIEIACIYLSFSGKFYPSIHYGRYPTVSPSEHRHVMEYVINNELSQKFDIKKQGSVLGAVKSIAMTWQESYDDMFNSFTDEDIVYLVQQLHNRIKSFMTNIAEIYYKIYEDKDHYLTFDSDNLSEDSYHLADSDSFKAERHVEKTMVYLNNNGIDLKLCKMASDSNVRTNEIYSIIETILSNNNNIPEVKEMITLIIYDYMQNSKTKDIRDVDFITYSIIPKPNSKNKSILRQKEILTTWLDKNSPEYRKRKSREATKSSYHKSVITYFTLVINSANK